MKKTYQRLPESELDIMLVLWNNTPLMNRMEIVAAGEGDEESESFTITETEPGSMRTEIFMKSK